MNSLHVRLSILVLGIVFATTGCGPTLEEIRGREQARGELQARIQAQAEAERQAADVKRQEEEAKLAQIRAVETAGDDAARQGDSQKALENYEEVLKDVQRYSEQDFRVRQSIIKVVRSMPAPPPLPESVMRFMVRGETKLKMGGTDSYEDAAAEMEQAVLAAPWGGDAYLNLGLVQEQAGKFNESIQNFKLKLLADPQSRDASTIQAKIYELEVKKEDQGKMLALQGVWYREGSSQCEWTLEVQGKKILLQSCKKGTSLQVEKEGRSLNGFIHFDAVIDDRIAHAGLNGDITIHGCNEPAETDPVTGTVSEDGNSLEFRYQYSTYDKRYQFNPDSADHNICAGISLIGKSDGTLKLVKAGKSDESNSGADSQSRKAADMKARMLYELKAQKEAQGK